MGRTTASLVDGADGTAASGIPMSAFDPNRTFEAQLPIRELARTLY